MATKKVNELNAFAADPVNADLVPVWDTDAEALKYATVEQLQASIAGTVLIPTAYTMFLEENVRNDTENWLGALQLEVDGDTLASGDDITFNTGIGSILVVPKAGTDVDGSITVTGNTVDQDDGTVTAADTETLVVDALATDANSTTAQGNTLFNLQGAYMTSKWFSGAITLSTVDLDLSDVDVYHVSFAKGEVLGDSIVTIFDMNAQATNTNAVLEAFLYTVKTTNDKTTIQSIADLRIASGDVTEENDYFRLRRGELAETLATADGLFVTTHFGPVNQNYWRDITLKVWLNVPTVIT